MKKNLTKLLALMMALALVFSLAACGGDPAEEESTGPSNAVVGESDTDAVVPDESNTDPSNTDPSAEGSSETAPVSEQGSQAADEPSTKAPGGNDDTPTGVAVPKNANEAMALYNAALAKTSISGKMSSVSLNTAKAGSFDLKSLDAKVEKVFKEYTLSKFNNKLFNLSGATLKGAAKAQNGQIVMTFNLKSVSEHNPALGKNGFMYFVTRDQAVTTVDNIVTAIGSAAEALEIKLDKNSVNIALSGTLEVRINQTTGKLTSATYNFTETVTADATAKLAIIPVTLAANIVGAGTCTYTGK